MKLLVVYLHCTWTFTLSLVVSKLLLVMSISYSPLSNRCNANIVISEVYVMFGHDGAGGRAPDETKDNSVKRSTKVVPPHKDDIVAFQNIERIWRSSRKFWC